MEIEGLKFRVWNGHKMEYKIMVGFLGAFYVQGMDEKDNACMSNFNTKYDESIHVMQFTGFKDINGNDIYEGDHFGEPNYPVIFEDGAFWYEGELLRDSGCEYKTISGHIFDKTE